MALIWADKVAQTTTTTGTVALALGTGINGYQTFADVMAVSDTCYYMITAVDADGVPSGDWEAGLGTYSAADTLTRTTVHASSNAGAAVDFAAGTKRVVIAATAAATESGSGSFFAGATGTTGLVSTSGYANKGLVIQPERALYATHVHALVHAANASTELYQLGIAKLKNVTISGQSVTACTVDTVLATSTAAATGSTSTRALRHSLGASPAYLEAGSYYYLYAAVTSGSGTTASRMCFTTATGTDCAWTLNFPGATFEGTPRFNQISLAADDVADLVSTDWYNLWIEGLIA